MKTNEYTCDKKIYNRGKNILLTIYSMQNIHSIGIPKGKHRINSHTIEAQRKAMHSDSFQLVLSNGHEHWQTRVSTHYTFSGWVFCCGK